MNNSSRCNSSNNNSNSSPEWRSNCSDDIREESTRSTGGVITYDLFLNKKKTAVKIAGRSRSRSVWFQVKWLNMETCVSIFIYMNRFYTHAQTNTLVLWCSHCNSLWPLTLIPFLSLFIDLSCFLTPVALKLFQWVKTLRRRSSQRPCTEEGDCCEETTKINEER